MSRSRGAQIVVLAIGLVLALSPHASGASSVVRGRLVRTSPRGQVPASGVQVTVYSTSLGRSKPAYSGADGMYYLYNIPGGRYTLEVWSGNPPLQVAVRVDGQAYTDVAPILVP